MKRILQLKGVDFELINNSVSFNSGVTTASGSGEVTVRVIKDGFKEEDEYIKFGVNITTSGKTVATTSKFVLNIKNDDFETLNTLVTPILNDDGNNFVSFNTFNSNGGASNWNNLSSGTISTPGSIEGNFYGLQATAGGMSDFIIAPVETFPEYITEIKITSDYWDIHQWDLRDLLLW